MGVGMGRMIEKTFSDFIWGLEHLLGTRQGTQLLLCGIDD